jgi:hypothetical protein
MALLTRSVAGLGLLLGGAFVLAAGCGSDDKKAVVRGDAGEAGAVAAAGGADGGQGHGGSSAGAAGELSAPGGAGEGGAPVAAAGGGDAGGTMLSQAGETSAGGFPAVDCTPTGAVVALTFRASDTFSVCRGGVGLLEFNVTDMDQQVVCCGSSSVGYDFEARGVFNNDGGGDLSYAVLENAPLGAQTLNATCTSGAIATPISINVTNVAPPIVDTVTQQVSTNGDLTIVGSNLGGVDRMQLVPVDPTGEQYYCNIDESTATAEKVTCKLAGGLAAGQYRVRVYADHCGAINSPTFLVIET